MSEGDRYGELAPSPQLLSPNRDGPVVGFDGWAYCAALPGRELLLAYLERGTPATKVMQLRPETAYEGMWFDPRTGEWLDPWRARTQSDGELPLPGKPTDGDWALKLLAEGGV